MNIGNSVFEQLSRSVGGSTCPSTHNSVTDLVFESVRRFVSISVHDSVRAIIIKKLWT